MLSICPFYLQLLSLTFMQNNLSETQAQLVQTSQQSSEIIQKDTPKPINPKYDRNYSKQQIALVFSYLNANPYFQNLKKQFKYVHWMSTEQKRKLLIQSYAFLAKSNISTQIQSIKHQTSSNHNFQTIKIVVIILYGKLYYQGKAFTVGQWIEISSSLSSIVQDKCVCLLFEKNIFQTKINQLNFFHYKKNFFKKHFLQKVGIDFPSKKIDQIVLLLQFQLTTQKIIIDHRKPQFQDPGIFIFIKGNFFICDSQNKICCGEISENYAGEESMWGKFRYNLKAKENVSEFLFCPKQVLITCLSQLKYSQLKSRLKELYEKKKSARNMTEKAISNLFQGFNDSKEKAQKKVKSRIDIQKCKETLQKIRSLKPKWQQEQEKKYKKTKNKRKNIFTEPSEIANSKRKYFSVSNPKSAKKVELKQKQPFEKQLIHRHFSSMKTDFGSTSAVTPLNSTRINNFMNETAQQKGFSKFARTSFYQQGNMTGRSYYNTPKKVKSEQKFQKNEMSISNQLDSWDIDYSKKYDRSLSWSVRKEKNLVKVQKLKEKVFPKERTQFFTIKDANEAIHTSFFNLERLRRQEAEEKNKRTFQKVFKQKMLLMDASRKVPLSFR